MVDTKGYFKAGYYFKIVSDVGENRLKIQNNSLFYCSFKNCLFWADWSGHLESEGVVWPFKKKKKKQQTTTL